MRHNFCAINLMSSEHAFRIPFTKFLCMMSKFKLNEVSLYDIENLSYMGLWVHGKTARILLQERASGQTKVLERG